MPDDDTKTVRPANTTATVATKPEASRPASNKVEEEDSCFKSYVWNQEKKLLFGRTCFSWLLITIFYAIFFIAITCFFVMCWFAALSATNTKTPYKLGDKAILGSNGPGLSIRPIPNREYNAESSLLWPGGASDEHKFWSQQLKNWFLNIPQHNHKNVTECFEDIASTGGKLVPIKEKDKELQATQQSCFVDKNWYGPCSEVKDSHFGYDRGELCILIKLNRINNWKPDPYLSADWMGGKLKPLGGAEIKVPRSLKNYILNAIGAKGDGSAPTTTKAENSITEKSITDPTPTTPSSSTNKPEPLPAFKIENYVVIWCDGENDHDKELLGSLEYYPGPYIPNIFFPYSGQRTNYQTPFVMLQLKRPVAGALISIVCQAYAKNIATSKESGVGYVRFQILTG